MKRTDNPSREPKSGGEPRLPDRLDAAALRQIEEAQEVMRKLIALVPRQFDHADETDFTFRPDHGS